MASVQIPEYLEDKLRIAAESSGRTKDDLVVEILAAHFGDESLPLSAFTDEQLTRVKESIEQVKRGELVSEEEVDLFFQEWLKELEAR